MRVLATSGPLADLEVDALVLGIWQDEALAAEVAALKEALEGDAAGSPSCVPSPILPSCPSFLAFVCGVLPFVVPVLPFAFGLLGFRAWPFAFLADGLHSPSVFVFDVIRRRGDCGVFQRHIGA